MERENITAKPYYAVRALRHSIQTLVHGDWQAIGRNGSFDLGEATVQSTHRGPGPGRTEQT